MRQIQSVWYSLTPADAVDLMHDGQSIKYDGNREDTPSQGCLSDIKLTGNGELTFWIETENENAEFLFWIDEVFFKTNDQKLEIVEPGVCVLTITLK